LTITHHSGLDNEHRSDHVEFVVDKVALEWISSKYFGFPCQFSFCQLLTIHQSSYHLQLHSINTDSFIKKTNQSKKIKKLFILPTVCISMLCVTCGINSNFIPIIETHVSCERETQFLILLVRNSCFRGFLYFFWMADFMMLPVPRAYM
jgi:uncharacterized membrane protein YwzB